MKLDTKFEIVNKKDKVIRTFDDRDDAWNYLDDNKGKGFKWRVKR